MRILPAALAISAVLHTGAIAWVHAHKVVDLQAIRPVTPPIEVEIVPTTVALLDDHTVKQLPELPSSASNTTGERAPARTAISTGRATEREATTKATHAEPPHTSMMTMRHPDKPDMKGPSGDFLSRFLENTKPLQPKAIEGERIQDDIDHGLEHLGNPSWIANASPDEVTAERERLAANRAEQAQHELKQDGRGYKMTHDGYDGHVEPDGTVHLKDKPTFDATDALMRQHGMDPYASNKLRSLDQTREERYQIGVRYKHELLGKSVQLAKQNVDFLWAKTTDLAARKQGLFEMWDECVETGTDDDQIAGGRAARRFIVGIIRGRLSGNDAYTDAELAAFNAHKKSTATFSPYDD